MSIYLRDIDAYDPDEFSSNVKALIDSAIKEVPMKDLFDEESCFYDNLLSEITDVLYSFCDEVADEAYDTGYESGRESGWEAGYENAQEEYDNSDTVDELEGTISELEEENSSLQSQIEELESELEELRGSPVIPEVDIDDLREAIRADLIAEMTDYEEND